MNQLIPIYLFSLVIILIFIFALLLIIAHLEVISMHLIQYTIKTAGTSIT